LQSIALATKQNVTKGLPVEEGFRSGAHVSFFTGVHPTTEEQSRPTAASAAVHHE
jgi:hypothetical protein